MSDVIVRVKLALSCKHTLLWKFRVRSQNNYLYFGSAHHKQMEANGWVEHKEKSIQKCNTHTHTHKKKNAELQRSADQSIS